ncbi:hypothetical protein NitYY0826_C1485 [Nitratiruptor sp. YY08-26]|uniref:hypothetical protein n=1 Tax=unclassified Nitratiruptor TaxID=2624044 RepID=UPI0019157A5E|nr:MULTISPECIES: hypothetical protein [unclassified Nitratiruptor]BCD62603.1 hypothetical protein NitYY0813_C1483 [Nitratiruptor sp. YY08-13]BCD66539.1 hypothetical protein NitYY0826_C1485 [Nitratiruptor sp. YY08-26]
MSELFRKKHVLWLKILFGGFSLPKGEWFDTLLDFANIEYRHLKWLALEIVENGEDFDWDREHIELDFENSTELFQELIKDLEAIQNEYGNTALFERIKSDESYMLFILRKMVIQEPIEIHSFKRHLSYKNLDGESLSALVQFLFEEIYKEYELIITYTYSQIHTNHKELALIFEDLIYESMYHLKTFCVIAAKLGILGVPRAVMKDVYRFSDLKQFLQDGIEEELAAKEQCKALSSAIKDEELSKFFDFINNQENYHIALMQKAVTYIT